MCNGALCDKKHLCYRYNAIPTEHWQSYFVEAPWVDHHGKQVCDKFWEIKTSEKTNKDGSDNID